MDSLKNEQERPGHFMATVEYAHNAVSWLFPSFKSPLLHDDGVEKKNERGYDDMDDPEFLEKKSKSMEIAAPSKTCRSAAVSLRKFPFSNCIK